MNKSAWTLSKFFKTYRIKKLEAEVNGAHDIILSERAEVLRLRDRIKELQAQVGGLLRQASDNHDALCRAEAAEAKLEKARRDGFNAGIKSAMGALMDADTIAQAGAALEKLKGQDDGNS